MTKQDIIIYKTKDGKASVALYARDGDICASEKRFYQKVRDLFTLKFSLARGKYART